MFGAWVRGRPSRSREYRQTCGTVYRREQTILFPRESSDSFKRSNENPAQTRQHTYLRNGQLDGDAFSIDQSLA